MTTTALTQHRIGIIGLGKMTGAILKGLLASQSVQTSQVWAVASTPQSQRHKAEEWGITTYTPSEYAPALAQTDLVLLGVKPTLAPEALATLKQHGQSHGFKPNQGTLLVSVVAGLSLSQLEQLTGGGLPIVRAMPNVPALVQAGVTAFCTNTWVSPSQQAVVEALFQAVGLVHHLPESQLNAITGLSGSGPAYILTLIEALTDAGVAAGLPRAVAQHIVPQLVLGTAKWVQQTGQHPAVLKDTVVTPAGTTAAGLRVLEQAGVRSALIEAVLAATERSAQLGSN
jgi:pyrroline-5-carboxylate reductase